MPDPDLPVPHCVAVLRFSAAGDVMLTAPAITALKRAWPSCRILFVTHERNAPLVAHHPDVDEVVPLRANTTLMALRRRLSGAGVDALCDLHSSLRSRALAVALRHKLTRHSRVAKRSLRAWALHRIAHQPYKVEAPLPLRYHQAVERLVGAPLEQVPLTFHRTPWDLEMGAKLLQRLKLSASRPLVALMPGAQWPTKRWPVGHFAALARMAIDAQFQVLVVGTPKEAALTRAICQGAKGSVEMSDDLPWGVLAALLARCNAVVVGDTGPMHLARAVGTRCVVLFGSTPADQFDLSGHQVLASKEHCSPCSGHGLAACPRGHFMCMVGLSPERVMAALTLTLRPPRPT